MSLINDALKQARRNHPRPPVTSLPAVPAAPPAEATPVATWLVPAIIIFLIVAAIFFIGWASAHHAVHALATAPEASTQSTASVIVPVAAPVPTDSPAIESATPLPLLQGIFYSPSAPTAIINGKSVSVGDKYEQYHVKEITKYTVTLVDAAGKSVKLGMGN